MPDAHRPLAGITVVEITQNLAGPYAGEILARLGADVLKIERPEGGDDARGWGPPFLDGAGSTFHAVNAGKRSIALDLRDPEAVARLRARIARADVLLQNLRAGALEALGLGAEAVRALNPRLIYCSLSAFGPTGPLSDRPGYEPMMQAFSGLMLTGGHEGDPPGRVGVPLLDVGTGMWAALGVIAGLLQRERTGRGCIVDASLFETALGWLGGHYASFRLSGRLPERHPTGSAKLIPFQAFETKTGPLVVAAGNDRLFAALARALDRPEWARDRRYANNAGRYEHRERLLADIEAVMRTRPKGEWLDRLEEAGVPCAPVQTLAEVLEQPQTAAAGIVQPVPGMDLTLIGLPLRFDGARPPIPGRAPRLGEHTGEADPPAPAG
jgi:crotonobetainyl-CoA:carnitine CoA-transferase CaiB-like acyl-CoA transferase